MIARTALVVSLIALVALSLAPSAEAKPPVVGGCLVGGSNNSQDCLVAYWTVQCVTFPCDPVVLCVAYRTVCL